MIPSWGWLWEICILIGAQSQSKIGKDQSRNLKVGEYLGPAIIEF